MAIRAVVARVFAMTGLAVAGPAAAATLAAPAPDLGPHVLTMGQNADGSATYLAAGYAIAGVGFAALGGVASGQFSFRVGGYCLDSANVALVATGVSGNTTAWSYALTNAAVVLVKDVAAGACNYTVDVTDGLSVTGTVTISQIEYTVFLKGSAAQSAPGGVLAVIP